jgi:hypothetical protein
MVQKINTVKDIIWCSKVSPLDIQNLILLNQIPFTLPKAFIDLLKISDGGFVDYIGIGEIYGICTPSTKIRNRNYYSFETGSYGTQEFFVTYHDIINQYHNPPEFFPERLLAFGSNGSGNRICFDYRTDPKTDNPPIVYWDHGADIGEDVWFEANNFEEFIKTLKEPEGKEEFNEEEFQQWLKSLK